MASKDAGRYVVHTHTSILTDSSTFLGVNFRMEGSGCGRCPAHCLLSSDDACRGGMKSCLQREETSPIGLKYDVS